MNSAQNACGIRCARHHAGDQRRFHRQRDAQVHPQVTEVRQFDLPVVMILSFHSPFLPHEHVIDAARSVVRPLFRAGFRNRQTLHRVDSLRLSAGRVRYSGFAGARRHVAPRRRPVQGRSRRDPARHGRAAGRDSRRRIQLVAGQGRRPPQHRSRADRQDRRRRQAPAHRALAQRPGGDRHPSVPARRHRPHSGRAHAPARPRWSIWPSSTPTR